MLPPQTKKLKPIDWRRVEITDNFWAPKLHLNRTITIPAIYERCKETGRIDAWKLDWKPGMPNQPHIFWDSDVAKWIEAAAYSLATHPDPKLQAQVEALIDLIAAAQQPDGYLNTHFTVVRPHLRWTHLRDGHELYCAGHLIEAAVAYFRATGKKKFLEIVCRYADYIDSVFGAKAGKKRGYCGHAEIELALVKLFQSTGERRYLNLAKYFVEERGHQPHYFDLEAMARGENPADYWAKTHAYTQSHLPVREQREVVGHAVRGMYLYCAMADLAVEFQDQTLLVACQRLFHHLMITRLYITGGIGSSRANEGYTSDYDLPNATASAETCAAIGLCFFAHRLLQIEPNGLYADVFERALYNGVLSGVALAGDTFFYENPLASAGDHHRWKWHRCSCCPPNLARLLASLGQYIYSQHDDEIYVHLYIGSHAAINLNGRSVRLSQQTTYPWDGNILIQITPERATEFVLSLRLPGWCPAPEVKVNGEAAPILLAQENGYVRIRRIWEPGDRVELDLPMPVERIEAHPAVAANCGRVALQRGPMVYCLEETDNGKHLNDLLLTRDTKLEVQFEDNLLGGVVTLNGTAKRRDLTPWEGRLYRDEASQLEEVSIKAIPYYAWDNRAPGEMLVWIRAG